MQSAGAHKVVKGEPCRLTGKASAGGASAVSGKNISNPGRASPLGPDGRPGRVLVNIKPTNESLIKASIGLKKRAGPAGKANPVLRYLRPTRGLGF